MRTTIATAIITTTLLSGIATAATLKESTPVCTSSEGFDELVKAIVTDDSRMRDYLVKQGTCTVLPAGTEYTPVERNMFSPSKIRVWLGGDPLHLFTSTEYLSSK